MRRALALVVCLLAASAQAGDRARVSWVNAPAYVRDDALVDYHLRIPRHPENRWLLVQAFDGDLEVSRSGPNAIDGDSPSLRTYRWRLPEGELQLIASLQDVRQQVYRARWPVTVLRMRP